MLNNIIEKELKRSIMFFVKESNLDKKSKGYGLIKDKTILADNIASIASVGYGLAALIVGVEHKWLSYKKVYDRVNGTLDTVLNNLENIEGFFYHFIDIETGKRAWNCEVSIIDTAILLCGVIYSGEYFKGEIKEKAQKIYDRINWEWYINKETNQFYMGYKPEIGFWGKWDMYGEQLMLYILSVGSTTYPVEKSIYYDFKRIKGDYKQYKDIIHTYCGTLFTYQFSHAWIDFRNKKDRDGIDWFNNSILATKANRQYCIDNANKYNTYGEKSWGLTSCIGPKGYSEYGAAPNIVNLDEQNDGTVAPAAAIGSIVFTPKETIEYIEYIYSKYKKIWGKYGFKDGYNFEGIKKWFAKEYIGIDKGIEVLMIENYLNGTIWKFFMKNTNIKKGLNILEINSIESRNTLDNHCKLNS